MENPLPKWRFLAGKIIYKPSMLHLRHAMSRPLIIHDHPGLTRNTTTTESTKKVVSATLKWFLKWLKKCWCYSNYKQMFVVSFEMMKARL